MRGCDIASCTRREPAGGFFLALSGSGTEFEHVLPLFRGAEEQVEGLLEDQRMLVALDEDRLQRGEDVGAAADVDHLERVHGIDHGARPDRHAGRAQRAGKADDVVGELLGLLGRQVVDGHGLVSILLVIPGRALGASPESIISGQCRSMDFRCAIAHRSSRYARPGMTSYSLVASFSTFSKASPCIRVMSSWYLSSAPSVSPTTCGVSERASSSESAVAQSMVSATPGDL